MPISAQGPPSRRTALRTIIIDDHEISRAAIRALLLAEGVAVIADFKANAHAVAAARALNPEVAIIDVTPTADTGFGIARTLCGLPTPPIVILTSSANRAQLLAEVDSYRFIAKADITATNIASLANIRQQARSAIPGERERDNAEHDPPNR